MLHIEEQMRMRMESLFGVADFYSRNLRKLGHEVTIHTMGGWLVIKILIQKWRSTRLRRKLAKTKAQLQLRGKVQRIRARGEMVRLVVGAGATSYEGWLMTDLPVLDALNSANWCFVFPQGSIDRVLMEHVVEHWTEDEFRLFLRVVRPFISEQGFIRIAIPDGFHPDPSYIDYVKPGGSGSGASDHKVLYNYASLSKLLSEEQWDYNLLEYFDEAGRFHCLPWEISDGFVRRSADYDPRNKEHPLSYTSLIIDAWPGGKHDL